MRKGSDHNTKKSLNRDNAPSRFKHLFLLSEELELLVEDWTQVERKNRARELEFPRFKEAFPEEPRYPYDYILLDNGKYANVRSHLDEQALERALERLKLREE